MKKTNRMLVVTRFFLALTTSVVAMAATEANGAWSDNFDSYVNGSTIIGQGAWAGWELAESGVNDTTVTNAQASSGPHSLMMGGAPYVDLVPQFAGATSGIWIVEAMSYVPEDSDRGIADIGFLSRHLGFQGAAYTQWFGAFRLDMANDFAGGQSGGFLPIIRDQWVPMRTILDIDDQTSEIFCDGEFADSGSWNGDIAIVGLDVWSEDDASTMYYDDFKVAPDTPELPDDDALRAGDADQDLDFDQLDLVKVQIAATYLTGNPATWGEGDWDGAPGGLVGAPPAGNGLFDQLDIIAALNANIYLTGPYAAIAPGGNAGDGQASIIYSPSTGEVGVDAPEGTELTSINIDSAGGIFTGDSAANLGGSFDNDADNNIFKATFGSSFGSLSFGNVAQAGLSEEFVLNDLSVVGSLARGGDLGNVDLVYVPEPSTIGLLAFGLLVFLPRLRHTHV